MRCCVCWREKLAHQMAVHLPSGLAVCFGGEGELCGQSATRPDWWLEKVQDPRPPAYVQLAALVKTEAWA